jgi:hypothetical protein
VRVDGALDQSPVRRAQRLLSPGLSLFTLTRPYLRKSAVRSCLRVHSRFALREIILPTHFRDRSFSRLGYNLCERRSQQWVSTISEQILW